jgi:ATP-binding cassette, subfamily B, multidrug efflux pump
MPASSPNAAQDLGKLDLQGAPQILGRILRLALRYRWRFAVATITSLFATVFNMAVPRLIGHAVDQAHALLGHGAADARATLVALSATAFLLVLAAGLRGVTQMISGFQSEALGQAVGRDLRITYFEKLQRAGFDFHDRMHSGDLITRGMLDLEGVRGFIETGLQRFIALVFLLVAGTILLFAQDRLMAALAMSFVPVVAVRAGLMGLRLRLAWTRLQERMSVLTRVMEECLQGVRVVRAAAAGPFEMRKFDEAGDAALLLSNRRILIRSGAMSVITLSYYVSMALVLWVGGHRVISGRFTMGQLTEFLTLMTLLQLPVRQIGMIMNASARGVVRPPPVRNHRFAAGNCGQPRRTAMAARVRRAAVRECEFFLWPRHAAGVAPSVFQRRARSDAWHCRAVRIGQIHHRAAGAAFL